MHMHAAPLLLLALASGAPVEDHCVDAPDAKCANLKMLGWCDASPYREIVMEKQCPVTCALLGCGVPETAMPATAVPATPAPTPVPETPVPDACVDAPDAKCANLKMLGWCDASPYREIVMEKQCPVTCELLGCKIPETAVPETAVPATPKPSPLVISMKNDDGRTIEATHGYIVDGWRVYDDNVDASVTVKGKDCTLEFLLLHTEGDHPFAADGFTCPFDRVKLAQKGHVFATHCGTRRPPTYRLGGDEFTVNFQSDANTGLRGFVLEFTCSA
eukprot:TRINITY_DN588_c0_g1_i1.p1 TRINITY_DN588_c0_g1~~TRINITY_DN588_c0_g1_i1.p1  ORF type:complete len:274 (+),score=96.41 TRINITY_DN588_c0_g1_i1:62-883(+)